MNRALRRPSTWALVVVAFIFVIFLRRWIHHAQLESIPVIVPQNIAASDVVKLPAVRVANRMLRDLRDLVRPPSYPRFAVLTFDDGPLPVTTPLLLAQLQ